MHIYNKSHIGRLIAWGGEHQVYEYETDKVIKFSLFYDLLGKAAHRKAVKDYELCQKFFGIYLLNTTIASSSNGKRIVHIQNRISGHALMKKDLENETIRRQFEEIVRGYISLIEASHAPIDLVGRSGVIRPCLSNIFVTDNEKLLIIDATLLETDAWYLKPIIALIRHAVIWRQNTTLAIFKHYLAP